MSYRFINVATILYASNNAKCLPKQILEPPPKESSVLTYSFNRSWYASSVSPSARNHRSGRKVLGSEPNTPALRLTTKGLMPTRVPEGT